MLNSLTLTEEDCLSTFRLASPRSYQIDSINEIIGALEARKDVALLLPTGTGKTFVYLPVAIAAINHAYRVCILVGTNLLIDQLQQKYFSKFSTSIKPHVVKGIEHYSCLLNHAIADYATCTKEQKEICKIDNSTCEVLKINKEFEEYPFIVTNFHKFLSASTQLGFDLVIIDDSHGFENALLDKFQTRIFYYHIQRLFNKFEGKNDILSDFTGEFLDLFDDAFSAIPSDTIHQRLPNEIIRAIANIEGFDNVESLLSEVERTDRNILRDLLHFIKCCKSATINTLHIQKDYYVQNDPSEATVIARKTDAFKERSIQTIFKDARVIFSSATPGNIHIHAKNCTNRAYHEENLSIVPNIKPDIIKNWFNGLKILETTDLPNNGSDSIIKKADAISAILNNIAGKTLLLFKSYRDQITVKDVLKRNVGRQITFIGQEMQNEEVQELVERGDIIMASASSRLWEGIDISNLKLEIIFSLPFIRPPIHLPVERSFQYVCRKMLIRLQQGVGRLIRNADDKGICIVLDSRLAKYKIISLQTPSQTLRTVLPQFSGASQHQLV